MSIADDQFPSHSVQSTSEGLLIWQYEIASHNGCSTIWDSTTEGSWSADLSERLVGIQIASRALDHQHEEDTVVKRLKKFIYNSYARVNKTTSNDTNKWICTANRWYTTKQEGRYWLKL